MNTNDRESLAAAAERGEAALAEAVQRLLNDGVGASEILEDLEAVRSLVSPGGEDQVLDVMDLVVGWCAPGPRLGRESDDGGRMLSPPRG